MRGYIPILAMAGLLLCSALLAGCTTTTTINATATPMSLATVVQTSDGGAGEPTAITLTAQNMKFDKGTITVPAGSAVTITFTNNDAGMPHNFALYTDASAATAIFRGTIVSGPKTTIYTLTAPSTPGTYFFRCDAHPTQMTGQFIVQ